MDEEPSFTLLQEIAHRNPNPRSLPFVCATVRVPNRAPETNRRAAHATSFGNLPWGAGCATLKVRVPKPQTGVNRHVHYCSFGHCALKLLVRNSKQAVAYASS